MTLADNGVGLPLEIDPAHSQSLGLELVSLLVKQLDATLTLKREGGTTFTISFPPVPAREAAAPVAN